MKTLRLTRAESAAYAAGERRFWRAMRVSMSHAINHPQVDPRQLLHLCRYGKVGDKIDVKSAHDVFPHERFLISVTACQRDGKWGWLVEVGR